MKAEDKMACPVCGTLLADNSESCPVCVLQAALKPETGSLSDSSSELRFEHFQVLKNVDGTPIELGHGGMGITYKAFDTRLRCPVALKIINARLIGDAAAQDRFVREARAAASVHHSNVASVSYLGESGANYFYAMEFVEGETLETLIRRSGTLKTDLALEIVTQVAAGLAAIHKQHLVHRDIKPSNIMVSLEDGRLENVKIIDLGLAKGVADKSAFSTVGVFIGTPVYASPEQFAGLATDIRCDLYSLGITLWEMLAGKPPFQGSEMELMDQHQHAALPTEKLRSVPAPVIALLQVLLAKDPNQRFQGPAQLQRALARVKEALASGSRPGASELRTIGEQRTAQSPKRTRNTRMARWLIASAVCAAVLLSGYLLFVVNHGSFFSRPRTGLAPSEKSIAVLPFESLSENKNDSYFADGVQDEILSNIARNSQLKVISRTSVMQYRGEAKRDLRQIADALGVANVLEGTVRRDGNHVRISTKLVDAHNDTTIWADSYDRDLTDIFAIQSDIAQKVALKLSAKLSAEEERHIGEKPTDNLEAYDLYLQAKQLLDANYWVLPKSEKEAFSQIISLLEEATQKDGKFALAYCLIAKAHDTLYFDRIDQTRERRALADAAVNEALRLRPDLPEGHLALASHLYVLREFERARVQIAIAEQALSNNADLLELTALMDRIGGRWEKAVTALENALTLDPRNPELLGNLVDTYGTLRRYRDAERTINRVIELEPDQPAPRLVKAFWAFAEKADVKAARAASEAVPPSAKDDPRVALYRVYFAMCARDFAAARAILNENPNGEIFFVGSLVPRRIIALWLEFLQGHHPTVEQFGAAREQLYTKVEADPTNPFLMTALAHADLALGHKEESLEEARRAMEMRPVSEDAVDGPMLAIRFAVVCAWANQLDLAFQQLYIAIRMPNEWLSYGELKTNPIWDPLRKDPRFDKLLAELAPKD
jgi:serine/threonine protein kinase/tetratricopeptide (TPR) repeat protein